MPGSGLGVACLQRTCGAGGGAVLTECADPFAKTEIEARRMVNKLHNMLRAGLDTLAAAITPGEEISFRDCIGRAHTPAR